MFGAIYFMNSLKKQVTLCTIGSVFEWYEFLVFALLTPIISTLFFPNTNHFAAMMSTFAIFASGYIMRPMGALFFGHLGDRLGRKYTLMITLFLMTGSTFAMGCIPVGGTFSALILLICRLAQGFSASGEYPAVLTLLSEQANNKRKGLITSTAPFGTGIGCALGALLCAVLFHVLGHNGMLHGGWRIPFLLAIPLGILCYFLREKITESSEFKNLCREQKQLKSPVLTLIKQHKKMILVMLPISILANIIIYVNFLFVNNYLVAAHKITTTQSSHLYLWTIVMYSAGILFFGFLSDYFNKKRFLMAAFIFTIILSYPLCHIIFTDSFNKQFIAQGVLSLLSGMVLGPFVAVLSDAFPTAVRYTALSVVLNFAGSLFGSTAPMICAWLSTYIGPIDASAFYLIFISLISLFSISKISLVRKESTA